LRWGSLGSRAQAQPAPSSPLAAGPQFVDIPLPFANPQLDAARRTYAERHPLGRDKEQLVRLKADVGRPASGAAAGASTTAPAPDHGGPAAQGARARSVQAGGGGDAAGGAKPERLLDYTVASSSSLLVAARPDLVLQSGLDAVEGKAGGSGGGAAVARAAGGGKGPPPNTLRLAVKPQGTGLYLATVTLTSAHDVRLVAVEVSAQCLGQSYALELECPARQQVRAVAPRLRQHQRALYAASWVLTAAADLLCVDNPWMSLLVAQSPTHASSSTRQASQDISLVNPGDGSMEVQATLTTTGGPSGGGAGSAPKAGEAQVFSGERCRLGGRVALADPDPAGRPCVRAASLLPYPHATSCLPLTCRPPCRQRPRGRHRGVPACLPPARRGRLHRAAGAAHPLHRGAVRRPSGGRLSAGMRCLLWLPWWLLNLLLNRPLFSPRLPGTCSTWWGGPASRWRRGACWWSAR
jgi:hypothetical protein